MKIKFKRGRTALDADIRCFEIELGFGVSDSFKAFVAEFDGCEPETNIFKISEDNDSGVNRFIPIKEIGKERKNIENLPIWAYPVAWAEGGNYVYIDQGENGAVFFWDHEDPENVFKLAENFESFLSVLKPFDASSIELKPRQVKSSWIDPDFLKSLGSD
jgi:hypothetical protein